ncbi:ricin-type beta-trefoil lectin domain protein [Streptomyces sp. NPDC127072]|uniref:RICIN domain-containing protein n=1 Tax=Streptomyces sp. NPDC127072 TaxID=3347129 RepID=UPI003669C5F6
MSDERLADELKKSLGNAPANYPVGELLDRHWEPVFSYARLCTIGTRPAGMLTTATFTRLFGESLRQTGPTAAWRPQLLVTVRRIAAEWLTDQRAGLLEPGMRSGPDDGGRAAARLLPPENRRLLARAFQRLPEPARCLLWHTEAEAEQLRVPAALLGIGEDDAVVELRRARERLREGCLEIHRELAPAEECRHYSRMLDVSLRRGGADLDPDLRRHMSRCEHCRHAADQLDRFNGVLALPLAEAVLGWGAGAYLRTRRGRTTEIVEVTENPGPPAAAPTEYSTLPADASTEYPNLPADAPPVYLNLPADAPRPPSMPPRTAPRARTRKDSRPSTRKAHRRSPRRRNVALAALAVSALVLIPLILWAQLSSGGEDMADGTSGASGSGPDKAPGGNPSWIGSGDEGNGMVGGRLRNNANGLCVGVVGGRPVKGAETELTSCGAKSVQQWTYEEDGLLRNVADPDLCLDSHLGYSVELALCTGESQPGTKNVRYDFTRQGALVPRWNQDLALTPASTDEQAALVLKVRENKAVQRWTLDTTSPSLQLEVVNWGADTESDAPVDDPAPAPSRTPSPRTTPEPTATPAPVKPEPTPSSSPSPTYDYCSYPYNYCYGEGRYGDPGYGYGYGYGYGGGYGYGDGYGYGYGGDGSYGGGRR